MSARPSRAPAMLKLTVRIVKDARPSNESRMAPLSPRAILRCPKVTEQSTSWHDGALHGRRSAV